MTATRSPLLIPVAAALAVGLGACGSDNGSSGDDDSATARACSARADLSTSMQKVVDDVKAGNLGDARDQLSDVRTKVTALSDAVSDLSADERDKRQPQIQELQDEVKGLTNVRSLTELSVALTTVKASASTLLTDLGDDLKCS